MSPGSKLVRTTLEQNQAEASGHLRIPWEPKLDRFVTHRHIQNVWKSAVPTENQATQEPNKRLPCKVPRRMCGSWNVLQTSGPLTEPGKTHLEKPMISLQLSPEIMLWTLLEPPSLFKAMDFAPTVCQSELWAPCTCSSALQLSPEITLCSWNDPRPLKTIDFAATVYRLRPREPDGPADGRRQLGCPPQNHVPPDPTPSLRFASLHGALFCFVASQPAK